MHSKRVLHGFLRKPSNVQHCDPPEALTKCLSDSISSSDLWPLQVLDRLRDPAPEAASANS